MNNITRHLAQKSFLKLLATSFYAALIAFSSHVSAALISVGSAAFSGSATVLTFEDSPGGGAFLPAGYGSASGVTFSSGTRSYEYSAYGSTLAAAATAAGLGNKAATWGCSGSCGTGFDLNLIGDQTRVGFYISSNVNISDTSIFAYRDGGLLGSQVFNFLANTIGFVGFEDIAGIDKIVIGNSSTCGGGCIYQLDNVMFESASVPEPSALALLGIGLAGLGIGRRKKV